MSDQTANELSGWFSTYGLITAERILERYKINLPQEDLLSALKTPASFYYQLLRLPLRHVFNGIILHQVQDYQLYAKKLIIDYLLSGESGREEGSPGTTARRDLEKERKLLIGLNDNFHKLELQHEKSITYSQAKLIERAHNWHAKLQNSVKETKKELQNHTIYKIDTIIRQAFVTLLCNFKEDSLINPTAWSRAEQILNQPLTDELKTKLMAKLNNLADFANNSDQSLADFVRQVDETNEQLRYFRNAFYQLILRAKDIILYLPDYRPNLAQETENKASLFFDNDLGESSA